MRYLVCDGCGWTARITEANVVASGYEGWALGIWHAPLCGNCGEECAAHERKREAVAEWRWYEGDLPDDERDWKYDEFCFTLVERVMAVRIDCPSAAVGGRAA